MKYFSLFLLAITFISCTNNFIGEEQPNTSENNFELFWNDFDQHYSLFEVRNIDWNAIYNTYRPMVNENTTDDELWAIFSEMIEELDDSHTAIFNQEGLVYRSGFELNNQSSNEFSQEVILEYIEDVEFVSSEDELAFASIIDKNIGYIYVGTMDGSNPSVIDSIVEEFATKEAIILDVRQNSGGDDRYSARLAAPFSDGEHLIYTVETRNGPFYNDFDELTKHYTQTSAVNFGKPVIVLTDRYTISAGEVFLLHMKSIDLVHQIGDTTAGDFSTVSNRRFLPNGWFYQYSIQKFLLPNGESLDGIGHVPDVYIKNTEENVLNDEDLVIEKALEFLSEEYGID